MKISNLQQAFFCAANNWGSRAAHSLIVSPPEKKPPTQQDVCTGPERCGLQSKEEPSRSPNAGIHTHFKKDSSEKKEATQTPIRKKPVSQTCRLALFFPCTTVVYGASRGGGPLAGPSETAATLLQSGLGRRGSHIPRRGPHQDEPLLKQLDLRSPKSKRARAASR